jgi:hypothetical protein
MAAMAATISTHLVSASRRKYFQLQEIVESDQWPHWRDLLSKQVALITTSE